MSLDDPILDPVLDALGKIAEESMRLPARRAGDDRPPIEKLPAIDSPAAAGLAQEDLEARYGGVVLCLRCALERASLRDDYAFPWPDAVPGLGARTIGPFARCEAERP
jgi:hypothetical protein